MNSIYVQVDQQQADFETELSTVQKQLEDVQSELKESNAVSAKVWCLCYVCYVCYVGNVILECTATVSIMASKVVSLTS